MVVIWRKVILKTAILFFEILNKENRHKLKFAYLCLFFNKSFQL